MKKIMTVLALSTVFLSAPLVSAQAAGGWLGVHPEQPQGVQVGDVIKGSPADISGLVRGDLIVRLNDRVVTSISQFSMEIYRLDPGTEVTLSVHRSGELKELKVKLEDVANHAYALSSMPDLRKAGATQSPFAFNRFPLPVKPFAMGATSAMGHTHDYQTRLKSVWSMLEAYERIAVEKKLGEESQKVSREIRGLLDQAQQQLDKYKINEGVALMERAYMKVQDALIQLRSGETLYHPLNFANPEAEYVYELGRNNVFQMLLEQALNAPGISSESTAEIEQARQLRGQAEANATNKEFKAGIGELEQSTTILITLLRKAGLDIP